MGSSNIDITLSTKDLEYNVTNWKVNTEITDSDHRVISFTVLSDQDTTTNQSREITRCNVEKADWDSFKGQLFVEAISKAAKSSIPTKGTQRGEKLPHGGLRN
ncbi:unnamed protein product [Macrosiphum euphorbiae]|uniref:Endonuclease/exonuclease/phosphatase domain-containing protein n=1 Tax=Macrosiphum euphorbiae TaxID=13131 RepID=A0AAV0WX02_9HEMI|nr:unnamed protein product [Macrosiphum euphorbiae]